MEINMIGVPIFYGADKRGPEFGPNKLRDKQLKSVIEKHKHKVFDLGNIYVPKIEVYNKYYAHDNLKYLEAVTEVNTNLAHSVYTALKSDSFPLIVGGDHSVGLGSISGVSRKTKEFAVVWMDAHGDINTHETSDSGNIHGMPLAKAMNVGHADLTNIYFEGQKVKPENVYILGARDLDEGEVALIKKLNMNVYSANEMNEKGSEAVMNAVIADIKGKGLAYIHLSFDLDFIDASAVPGTGTPVSEGVSVDDTKIALRTLATSGLVKSMDFVELNVLLDKNDQTANLSIDLLDWMFKHL